MSRARYQARRDSEADWPALTAFLGDALHGADNRRVEDDIDAAISELPLGKRIDLTREWWRWNATAGAVDDIHFAIEALDRSILFGDAGHARSFMNDVYDKLIVSVRREAGKDWKP